MTVPLAARLRTATHELHRLVERAGLMPALLRGQLPMAGYLALLRNLQPIYAALESGLARHAAHPQLAPLPLAGLARAPALAADLESLHGPGWALDLTLCAAAQAYVGRLQQLADHQPALLAAHAYVRYLGDLNGGQVLARRVGQALRLSPGQGLAFYDFGPDEQAAAQARALRDGLDAIAPDEPAAQALVDEACAAFERHRELFEQLERPAAVH
jgi:heme oxygenase